MNFSNITASRTSPAAMTKNDTEAPEQGVHPRASQLSRERVTGTLPGGLLGFPAWHLQLGQPDYVDAFEARIEALVRARPVDRANVRSHQGWERVAVVGGDLQAPHGNGLAGTARERMSLDLEDAGDCRGPGPWTTRIAVAERRCERVGPAATRSVDVDQEGPPPAERCNPNLDRLLCPKVGWADVDLDRAAIRRHAKSACREHVTAVVGSPNSDPRDFAVERPPDPPDSDRVGRATIDNYRFAPAGDRVLELTAAGAGVGQKRPDRPLVVEAGLQPPDDPEVESQVLGLRLGVVAERPLQGYRAGRSFDVRALGVDGDPEHLVEPDRRGSGELDMNARCLGFEVLRNPERHLHNPEGVDACRFGNVELSAVLLDPHTAAHAPKRCGSLRYGLRTKG